LDSELIRALPTFPHPSPLPGGKGTPRAIHFAILCIASACTHGSAAAAGPVPAAPELELVETAPAETTLDHPDIPNAADVWPAMIRAATKSLDFAEFYATNHPKGRLEPVIEAVEAAADRGVRVRFLADGGFAKKEPDTLDRLSKRKGIEVRRYDWAGIHHGGIHHAKYFVVDGREAFLGSQNFDWRSLEHIQELGVRTRVPAIVEALGEVFETDWAIAGGSPRPSFPPKPDRFPVAVGDGASAVRVSFVATPKGLLPDESEWSLPKLVGLVDSAKRTVRVQVLTYNAVDRDGYFDELESALRRAAARGVIVQMLVADWSKRSGVIEGLKSLQQIPGITVKLVTIPPSSQGFIPYARVVHAKYLVIDGEHAWVGTSNWERSYFYKCRNVGLIFEGASIAQRLDRFFLDGWESPYAAKVDPCASYQPPHVAP
jgi:phosphatidylserine/phosphatidylglycerophosphate/cardiolipin synthase-like enzyme